MRQGHAGGGVHSLDREQVVVGDQEPEEVRNRGPVRVRAVGSVRVVQGVVLGGRVRDQDPKGRPASRGLSGPEQAGRVRILKWVRDK